jgi:nuclear GTP-binding protein
LAGAARIVLRDWSIGKFDRYTTPPSAPVINTATAQSESSITAKLANPCDNITQLYVNDEAILSTIQTRKERRKQGGLVKFAYGSIDPRKVAVDEPWNGLEQNDDEEREDDVDDEVDDETNVEGMDIDGEDEDEENEEEDEEDDEEASDAETGDSREEDAEDADQDQDESEIELPRLSPVSRRKQKRKREPERSIIPSPPAKKVAFSVMPPARGSKSDRQKIGLTTKGKLKEPMKIAQQQKKKPLTGKPVAQAFSSRAAMKSPITATANPVDKTSEKKGKIANVTTKIKAEGSLALARQSKDKSESEVYDFGKFF